MKVTKKQNNSNETCSIFEEFKIKLEEYDISSIVNYKIDDKFYLITDFMIITYDEKDKSIDIVFHVATKPNVSSKCVLLLSEFNDIKKINILDVFIRGENGEIIYGDKSIEEHQKNIRTNIINNFMEEQAQMKVFSVSQVMGHC